MPSMVETMKGGGLLGIKYYLQLSIGTARLKIKNPSVNIEVPCLKKNQLVMRFFNLKTPT
jgi:hypothetical protein